MGNLRFFSASIWVGAILYMWAGGLAPGTAHAASQDLTEFSITELINMKVTSVSKKPEERSKAAAAIFVVTQDDIRRSGVTSIPEALRMVPGLSVARLDSNKWSITSRGFRGRFSNKLPVPIDGRRV